MGLAKSIENLRKEKGPDYTIMFDCHCAIPPAMLIQFASAVEPYNVLWLEEPACPGNIEVFKRLKQQIRIPIAFGERDRTIWEVAMYLQNGCVDILQPDVGQTGGISQMRKIAALVRGVPRAAGAAQHLLRAGPVGQRPLLRGDDAVFDSRGIFRRPHHAAGRGEEELGGGRRRLRLAAAGAGAGRRDGRSTDRQGRGRPEEEVQWPTPTYADGAVRDY